MEGKTNKNQVEEALLISKKQELAELLTKKSNSNTNSAKSSDKTALTIGCGVIGMVLIGLVLILVRKKKNKKH